MTEKIAVQARTWLGTPFRHQGRVKGVGVDCLGLLVGVAQELELRDENGRPLASYDSLDYGHIPNEKRLAAGLLCALQPKECIESGHIGLFKIDASARHLAIFSRDKQDIKLIHAYAPARKVVEHRFDDAWNQKLVMVMGIDSP